MAYRTAYLSKHVRSGGFDPAIAGDMNSFGTHPSRSSRPYFQLDILFFCCRPFLLGQVPLAGCPRKNLHFAFCLSHHPSCDNATKS